MRKLPVLLFVVAVVGGGCASFDASKYDGYSTKVLLVGNSVLFTPNDVGGRLQAIARALDGEKSMAVVTYALAGTSLAEKRSGTEAYLKSPIWNYVVLQERSSNNNPASLTAEAKWWVKKVTDAGARPILFEHWYSDWATGDKLLAAYETVKKESGLAGAPIKQAWDKASMKMTLKAADAHPLVHANERGAYLIACVLYATITGKSPVGAPPVGDITAEDARFLQQTAWDAVRGG